MKGIFPLSSLFPPCSITHPLADLSRTSGKHRSSIAVLQLDCSFLRNEGFSARRRGRKAVGTAQTSRRRGGGEGESDKEAEWDNVTDCSHEKPSVSVVFIHTDHPSEEGINGCDMKDCFPFIYICQPATQQQECWTSSKWTWLNILSPAPHFSDLSATKVDGRTEMLDFDAVVWIEWGKLPSHSLLTAPPICLCFCASNVNPVWCAACLCTLV